MRKRIAALFLILILIFISLSGCSKGPNEQTTEKNNDKTNTEQKENKKTEATMGRYMEKEIELPKLEGDESIIKILQNIEKQFEVYTVNSTASGYEYLCYLRKEDMTWEKSKPGWLNDTNLMNKNISLTDLCLGEDGNYYACLQSYEEISKSLIIKSENADTAEMVEIPFLNNPVKVVEDKNYYPMIQRITVLQSGNIVLSDMWNENSLLIFNPQGEKTDEVTIGTSQNFMARGNNIIVINEEEKIICYNTETKNIDRSIEFSSKSNYKTYALKEDGTLLMGDSNGIHRLAKDGTLWETTVDGSLNSMSMPSLIFQSVFVKEGEQEEYYAVYTDEDYAYHLKNYVFDNKVSAVPAKEITVYSLKENKTVRQAISLFQAQNSDVKINYVVAMGEEGGIISDYIRALNAELLSGKGADILLLDELPVASYIEKGVLADITELIRPIEESGELLANISENYHMDGKVYQMPIRFSLPLIVGKEEPLRASDSLAGIVDYIQNNKDIPFTNQMSFTNLLVDYLALNSENLFQEGKLQENHLISFLESLKIVGENIEASESENSSTMTTSMDGFNLNSSEGLFAGGIFDMEDNATTIIQISSVFDTIIPIAMANKKSLNYSSIGQRFIPRGLIGLNSTSTESDLAKKFVSFLYTKEIQDTNLYDGFPVIQASIQKWFAKENENLMICFSGPEGGMITATWPEKDERDALLKLALEVKNPIEINQILNDMIIEEALLYFTGEKDIHQVTSAIVSKVNTYLAE